MNLYRWAEHKIFKKVTETEQIFYKLQIQVFRQDLVYKSVTDFPFKLPFERY
jgi:hypothetical protein